MCHADIDPAEAVIIKDAPLMWGLWDRLPLELLPRVLRHVETLDLVPLAMSCRLFREA